MKKVFELIKYSGLDDERTHDLYENLADAKECMNLKVEMFLDVMKSITGNTSNYRVQRDDSNSVNIINKDNGRVDLGFEIKVRKLN